MRSPVFLIWAWVALWPALLRAEPLPDDILAAMVAADVVILGEVHDNPDHHIRQAMAVAALRPRAVVWEMLSAQMAGRVTADLIGQPQKLEQVLEWDRSGWPDFAMYYPIFQAAPGARIYGANVSRDATRAVMVDGLAGAFGEGAGVYGLTRPLPADEQAAREADQMAAHCDALPAEILPGFVDIQRLRDARLAQMVVQAMAETAGPVVVITGNGHARKDRGLAAYLQRVAPQLRVFALGQSEAGRIEGVFDAVLDSPEVARPDPCDAFAEPEQ